MDDRSTSDHASTHGSDVDTPNPDADLARIWDGGEPDTTASETDVNDARHLVNPDVRNDRRDSVTRDTRGVGSRAAFDKDASRRPDDPRSDNSHVDDANENWKGSKGLASSLDHPSIVSDTAPLRPEDNVPCYVLGLAVDNGSNLEIARKLLNDWPPDLPMAIVVMRTSTTDDTSSFGVSLGNLTGLEVRVARRIHRVEPGHVYVVAPGHDVVIRGRELAIFNPASDSAETNFSRFFESLASERRSQGIAIALGFDDAKPPEPPGASAVTQAGESFWNSAQNRNELYDVLPLVHQAGGLVITDESIANQPKLFGGQGNSITDAAGDGNVSSPTASTEVVSGRIRLAIRNHVESLEQSEEDSDSGLSGGVVLVPGVAQFMRLVNAEFGIDTSQYRVSLVSRMLHAQVKQLHHRDVNSLMESAKDDSLSLNNLFREVFVGNSTFFDHPDAFRLLINDVLTPAVQSLAKDDTLRIWVCGASTGEEAYSLAILIRTLFRLLNLPVKCRIFATDVNERDLEFATRGLYRAAQIEPFVGPQWLENFSRYGDGYQVSWDIRQMVVFARHDVLTDPPFTRLHMVVCRRLLSYFRLAARDNVLRRFRESLRPDGSIWLGHDPPYFDPGHSMELIDRHQQLFRKLSQTPVDLLGEDGDQRWKQPSQNQSERLLRLYRTMLSRHMPPSLVINRNDKLIEHFGGGGKYLAKHGSVRGKRLSDILEFTLLSPIAEALAECRRTGRAIVRSNVKVGEPSSKQTTVRLLIQPIVQDGQEAFCIEFHSDDDLLPDSALFGPRETPLSVPNLPMALPRPSVAPASPPSVETAASPTAALPASSVGDPANQNAMRTHDESITQQPSAVSGVSDANADGPTDLDIADPGERSATSASEQLIRQFDQGSADDRDQMLSIVRRQEEHFSKIDQENERLHRNHTQLTLANEQLQSTIEEVHGVNQELYAINVEHTRKIAELMQLNDDTDNLLASTDVDSLLLDRDLRIRRVTSDAARNFKIGQEDIGKPFADFENIFDQKDLIDELRDVLQRERADEREVRDEYNNIYWMRMRPYVSRGSVDGIILTLVDITPIKKAQGRIAELSEIVEQSDDAIFRIDREGIIRSWNLGGRVMLGEDRHMIGRPLADLFEDEPIKTRDAIRAMAENMEVQRFRNRCRRIGGDWIEVAVSISPLSSRDNTLSGGSVVLRDISDQIRAEAEAQQGVRRRDEFLAMLSHELRNPLGAIVNAARIIRDRSDSDGDPLASGVDQKQATEVIVRQSDQMSRLLDDLLDVTRVTLGKIELRRRTLDFRDVIDQSLRAIGEQFEDQGLEFHYEPIDSPMPVDGDAARLQQVVVNLLRNAIKYTPHGGTIDLSLRRLPSSLELRIRDTGIGIDMNDRENIFDMFVQASNTLQRSEGGIGLGLTLVRAVVDMHGGDVMVHSDGRGQGSDFRVSLPLTDKPPDDFEVESRTSPIQTIVIVEDIEDALQMLQSLLELRGFQVQSATNGLEGLELIEQTKPDLALIDIGLPGIDGYEIAKRLRRNRETRPLYLVALTGYGQASDRLAVEQAGFDEHLVKPLSLDDLERVLTRE